MYVITPSWLHRSANSQSSTRPGDLYLCLFMISSLQIESMSFFNFVGLSRDNDSSYLLDLRGQCTVINDQDWQSGMVHVVDRWSQNNYTLMRHKIDKH